MCQRHSYCPTAGHGRTHEPQKKRLKAARLPDLIIAFFPVSLAGPPALPPSDNEVTNVPMSSSSSQHLIHLILTSCYTPSALASSLPLILASALLSWAALLSVELPLSSQLGSGARKDETSRSPADSLFFIHLFGNWTLSLPCVIFLSSLELLFRSSKLDYNAEEASTQCACFEDEDEDGQAGHSQLSKIDSKPDYETPLMVPMIHSSRAVPFERLLLVIFHASRTPSCLELEGKFCLLIFWRHQQKTSHGALKWHRLTYALAFFVLPCRLR